MNFVMTGAGKFIEVQGTAETSPFTRKQMERMAEIAQAAIKELLKAQKKVIGSLPVLMSRS
jgi:ribonuclease PH